MQPQYLRNELYQENSPVFHVGSYMKKTLDANDQVSERLLSLVFKNISNKNIIAIQGTIHNYDPFNELLGETPFTLIEIPDFKPGNLYGETVFFKVNNQAVLFKLEIKRITFQGFETKNLKFEAYENIEVQNEIDQFDEKQYIFRKIHPNMEYIRDLKMHNSYYHCVCGSMNQIQNTECVQCKTPKETIHALYNDDNVMLDIENDSKLYIKSVFKKTELSFDMSEENIKKLFAKHSLDFLINQIKDERDAFQRLDKVIYEKIKHVIPSTEIFNDLIERFKKMNSALEKTKEDKLRKEQELQNEKKLSEIIVAISKDIESNSFKINIENYNEYLLKLTDDLKRLRFIYFFKTRNLEEIKNTIMSLLDSEEGLKKLLNSLQLFKENLEISKIKHFGEIVNIDFDEEIKNMISDIIDIKTHLMTIHNKLKINDASDWSLSFNEKLVKLGFFNTWGKVYIPGYLIDHYKDFKYISKIDKLKLKSQETIDFIESKQNIINKFLVKSEKVTKELNTYIKRIKITYFVLLGLSIIPGLFLAISGVTNSFLEYIFVQAFIISLIIIFIVLRFEFKISQFSNEILKD